jgi:hypothetical protein
MDAFWHLFNFFLPAVGVAGLAAAIARLLWRREMKAVPFKSLWVWAAAGATVAWVAGLVWLGGDGRMESYGLLLLGCAAGLWWRGFGARNKR